MVGAHDLGRLSHFDDSVKIKSGSIGSHVFLKRLQVKI